MLLTQTQAQAIFGAVRSALSAPYVVPPLVLSIIQTAQGVVAEPGTYGIRVTVYPRGTILVEKCFDPRDEEVVREAFESVDVFIAQYGMVA